MTAVQPSDLARQIQARATHSGVSVAIEQAQTHAAYLTLLAKWNRTINLTALPLDPPTDAAIDRLIVEPILGAVHLGPDDRFVLDVGSGGGSPAIPMKIAAPDRRFALVEVRDRKSAFLREAIRHLALADTEVRTTRMEARDPPGLPADVVTVRAVRMDEAMVEAIGRQLREGGRILWFRSGADTDDERVPTGLSVISEHPSTQGSTSCVLELRMA